MLCSKQSIDLSCDTNVMLKQSIDLCSNTNVIFKQSVDLCVSIGRPTQVYRLQVVIGQ